VTKYSITAEQQQQPDAASFSIRDVFVARPGYVLLSAGKPDSWVLESKSLVGRKGVPNQSCSRIQTAAQLA
jgi:hypothetical protein